MNDPQATKETARMMKTGLAALGAASMLLTACTPPVPAAVAAVNDKVYTVTPDAMKVKAGMVTGELTEMKVTERVEAGSGRVTAPAKLTGKLSLKNTSADQTMRMVGAKIRYIDMQGKPIAMEDNRTAPTVEVAPQNYSRVDRLDPGQESTHTLDTEFPVAALKAKNLKEVRLELSFIPSQFKEETLNFNVSIGGQ
jgi:hypothetical protein